MPAFAASLALVTDMGTPTMSFKAPVRSSRPRYCIAIPEACPDPKPTTMPLCMCLSTVCLAAWRRREELSALVTRKGTVFLQVLELDLGFELVLILTGVEYTSVDVANDAILE